MPLQVLGRKLRRKKKKINLSSYFLSHRPSFYISPIKSTLQHCQYCWSGDAHVRRISLIICFEFKSTQPPVSIPCAPSAVTLNQVFSEFCVKAHLGLMKNRYWISTVMRKNTTPSTAMAKRFRPTKSQDSGETKRFSPGHSAEIQSEWRHQRS